jgi:hypothetical protein
MNNRSFSWKTEFKSIIIVDNELFHNTYNLKFYIQPVTADLKEQSEYFERLKFLFQYAFANTIVAFRDEPLYNVLVDNTNNRFVELPREPYDQIMAAVCFTKSNAVLDGKIIVSKLELSSYQGDGIAYTITKDGPEIQLLDVDEWWTPKYNKFDPWWLRPDTATYDEELEKGIYTGHFNWNDHNSPTPPVDKQHQEHAKIFEFNPKVLDGGKSKDK